MSKKKEMNSRINPGDILDEKFAEETPAVESVKPDKKHKDKKEKPDKEDLHVEAAAEELSEEKKEVKAEENSKAPSEEDQPQEPAAHEKKLAHKKKHKKNKIMAVSTENAPAAIGPYSQAVIAGNILFASGQIPADPKTGAIVGTTITEQAEQVMKNVAGILEAAGTDFDHVVKTTCFIKDMADFAAFNEVYASYFNENKPARSCVAVREIPKGVLCEVEVTAFLK